MTAAAARLYDRGPVVEVDPRVRDEVLGAVDPRSREHLLAMGARGWVALQGIDPRTVDIASLPTRIQEGWWGRDADG